MLDLILIFQSWQFNLLAYLIFHILFYQFYKLAVRDVKRDGVATILLQTIGGLSILLFSPLFSFTFPKKPQTYFLFIGACIFYALHDRLQTTIRKNLQVSVYSIIDQLSKVFLIAFGILIFREPFILSKIFGASLILGANVFLFYKKGKINFNKYAWLSFFATFIFAIALSIDIDISKQFNLPFYIMLSLIIPTLMIALAEKISFSEVKKEFISSENRKYYLVCGLSWGLLIFFMLRAFTFGKVTIVSPLSATSVFLNVIIAYLFLKERKDKLKKIIAAILVIIGIYLTV